MKFDILTLFPDIIHSYANESILGRAQAKKLIQIAAHNFRDYTLDKQHHVDDRPYGGGAGMILQIQPIFDCLRSIKAISYNKNNKKTNKTSDKKCKILLMDPAGKKFDQRMAEKLSKFDRIILIAGRYEGFDARIHKLIDERVSVGDYVLAGGELPALTIVEAVSRLIPGVLGNAESLKEETFNKNHELRIKNSKGKKKKPNSSFIIHDSQKEYPQYTRPENFLGWKVPKVLTSGDHKKIEEWRRKKTR